MHLTSSTEPTGPKSKDHYIVLHSNNRRQLTKLPETYPDLENHVGKIFNIDAGRFCVETDDLNVCKGQRVSTSISSDDWGDICQLIGNVYIVPKDAPIGSNPESPPESGRQIEVASPGSATGSGSPRPTPRKINSEKVYKRILSCSQTGDDASKISKVLGEIRKENEIALATASDLLSGITWKGLDFPLNRWLDCQWNMKTRSLLVVRFDFTEQSNSQTIGLYFGPPDLPSLRITVSPQGQVHFHTFYEQYTEFTVHPTIILPFRFLSSGQHTVAFLEQEEKLHIIFDFTKSVVLSDPKAVSLGTRELYLQVAHKSTAHVDVYQF